MLVCGSVLLVPELCSITGGLDKLNQQQMTETFNLEKPDF